MPSFNLLPMLTDEEMESLKAIYTDDASLLEAMWDMKKQKKREEEGQ